MSGTHVRPNWHRQSGVKAMNFLLLRCNCYSKTQAYERHREMSQHPGVSAPLNQIKNCRENIRTLPWSPTII